METNSFNTPDSYMRCGNLPRTFTNARTLYDTPLTVGDSWLEFLAAASNIYGEKSKPERIKGHHLISF